MLLRLVQDRQHHVPHSPLGLQLISVAETFAASEAWCWVTGCEALRLHSTKTRPRDLTAGEMQAEPPVIPVEICRNAADSHHVSKTCVNRRHIEGTMMWCSFRFWSTDQCFALKLAYLRKVWLGLASASIQAVRCHHERCLAWILEGSWRDPGESAFPVAQKGCPNGPFWP